MTDAAVVVCRTEGAEGRRAALGALWRELETPGWRAGEGPIVIQVSPLGDVALALETARSLAAFLEARGCRVELDGDETAAQEPLRIAGLTPPGELVVPRRWFEPHLLVTVAAVVPSAAGRVAGVLAAQAEVLRGLGNPHAEGDLVYEAHRLAASDLAIACGHADADDPASPAWWLAGTSDVAVERAVASAAGLSPDALPSLRVLARHEVLPEAAAVRGTLPVLHGVLAPAWRSRGAAAAARLRASRAALTRDARMLRRNLYKIPGFVRRRLARRGKEAR
jgi:hypothetical protein